jgi:hydroxyacylglutathione hydrolase
MFVKQFHLESLGHASYLVGDEGSGEALVLDPRRDVEEYLRVARERGLRISYVLDTHGHNDYLTGLSELVSRVPEVRVLAPALGTYGYDHQPLRDGEVVELGDVAFEALHTPGHTPEHVSLLVHDRSVGQEPAILLSGGALLVGDVARPDLLSGGSDVTRQSAESMRAMLRDKILALPDHVEVFPTHVAGSLCGGAIGARLSTTVGYERRTNPVLRRIAEDRPLEEIFGLDTLPIVPPYWRRMRAQNMTGPELVGVLAESPALTVEAFGALMAGGAVVLDARQPEAFLGGHIPGSLNVGLGSSFPTWAGTVLQEDAEVLVILDRPEDLATVTWELLRTGYRPPIGWLGGGIGEWRAVAGLARVPQLGVREAFTALEREELHLVDVRQPAEWAGGHAPGARFVPGGELPAHIADLPDDGRPVAFVCGGGYRSVVMASVAARAGLRAVNVIGGMSAWEAAGLPTVQEAPVVGNAR